MPQKPDPSISVIIIAYNEAAVIGRCLDAVMLQTQPAEEIILVDNNSKDATVEIAKHYPIKIVHETKQGFIPARNRGFSEAKSSILIRIDSDTVMHPHCLQYVREIFKDHPQALAVSGPVYYNDFPIFKRATFPFPGNPMYMRLIGCWPTLVGPQMVLTKQAWELVKDEVSRNDRIVHEDMDLSMHIRQHGEILYDKRLVVETSARRIIQNPKSFFLEYPWRNFKTLWVNRRLLGRRPKRTQGL